MRARAKGRRRYTGPVLFEVSLGSVVLSVVVLVANNESELYGEVPC